MGSTGRAVVAFLLVALPASDASAAGQGEVLIPASQASIELGLFTKEIAGTDLLVLTPMVAAWHLVSPHVGLEGLIGFQHISVDGTVAGLGRFEDSRFQTGNPYLGARWVGASEKLGLSVGAGIALPVASIPDRLDDAALAALGYVLAIDMHGAWDHWLWLPETLSTVLTGSVTHRPSDKLQLRADVGGGMLFPTGDRQGTAEFGLQVAGEVAWINKRLELGARVQGVLVSDEDVRDAFQGSVVPFVRGHFRHGHVGASFTINLDGPAGGSFEEDGIWGIHVGGGFRL